MGFCVLILYPATLPHSLVITGSFLVSYSVLSSTNSDSFTTFPIWIPFSSFSSLIAMARTSKTMFSKSDKSGQPCLIPYLRGTAISFSLLSMMLAIGLFCMLFTMLQ